MYVPQSRTKEDYDMPNPENDLFSALIDITGAAWNKLAMDSEGGMEPDGDENMKGGKKKKGKKKGKDMASMKMAEILDHPNFLKGFEDRLSQLREQHGFLGQ